MTILFDATRSVKSASQSFGRGILPTRPARFVPTAAETRWAAETSPFADREYDVSGPSDAMIEEAYQEALIRDRYEAGHRWH